MKKDLAELKIPASPAFIPVAKRVATTLGSQLGLSLVDLDELTIALTQACDSAIAAAGEHSVHSELKLTYFATNRALVVDVDLLPSERHMMLPATVPAVLDAQELANAELQPLAYQMVRPFRVGLPTAVEPSSPVRIRVVHESA